MQADENPYDPGQSPQRQCSVCHGSGKAPAFDHIRAGEMVAILALVLYGIAAAYGVQRYLADHGVLKRDPDSVIKFNFDQDWVRKTADRMGLK